MAFHGHGCPLLWANISQGAGFPRLYIRLEPSVPRHLLPLRQSRHHHSKIRMYNPVTLRGSHRSPVFSIDPVLHAAYQRLMASWDLTEPLPEFGFPCRPVPGSQVDTPPFSYPPP